jgi:hypothetical protein
MCLRMPSSLLSSVTAASSVHQHSCVHSEDLRTADTEAQSAARTPAELA